MVLKSIKRKFYYLFALVFTATILLIYSVVIQPLNCETTELVIPQGSSLGYVIDELKRCKCIKNGEYFKYLMIITSKDTKIKPGTYDLSPVENNYELSNLISTGTGEMITVSTLEGWSIDEISRMFFRKFDIFSGFNPPEEKTFVVFIEFLKLFQLNFSPVPPNAFSLYVSKIT